MSQIERGQPGDFKLLPFQGPQTPESLEPQGLELPPSVASSVLSYERREMLRLSATAKECFPLGAGRAVRPKVMVYDRGTGLEQYFVASDYLSNNGVNPEELEVLFTEMGQWKYRDTDRSSIYNYNSQAVDSILRKMFAPINRIVDRALDGNSPDGFNKHGEQHTDRVARQGLVFLKEYAGESDEVQRNFLIAARPHDIGCLFARQPHPYISLRMLRAILPTVEDDTESFKKIAKAVLFHDSDTLTGITSRWGNIPSEERLKKLADYMQPEGLALLIADKVEVGRDRVSDKIMAENIIKDPHAVVNLLGRHDRIGLEKDTLVWQLKYNPDFTPAEMQKFKHFATGWQRRRRRGEVNINFEDWKNMFWGIYTNRVVTLTEAAFAYLPFIGKMEVQMKDAQTGDLKAAKGLTRDNLDNDIANLRQEQYDLIKQGVLEYR